MFGAKPSSLVTAHDSKSNGWSLVGLRAEATSVEMPLTAIAGSHSRLSLIRSMANENMSMPAQRRPNLRAASMVVPHLQKGSSTVDPSFELGLMFRPNSVRGFCVGQPSRSLACELTVGMSSHMVSTCVPSTHPEIASDPVLRPALIGELIPSHQFSGRQPPRQSHRHLHPAAPPDSTWRHAREWQTSATADAAARPSRIRGSP